jgi:hypothetical protein
MWRYRNHKVTAATLASAIALSAAFSAAQSPTSESAAGVPLPSQELERAVDEARLLLRPTPELLVELEKRASVIGQTLAHGALDAVWVPAMATKTVAVVLEGRLSELSEDRRPAAATAIRQIVISAWNVDTYGDTGNRARANAAYADVATGVSKLKAVYAP